MRRLSFFLLTVLASLNLLVVPLASADNTPSLTQTYQTNSAVLPGMLVELLNASQPTVGPLETNNVSKMFGVAVPVNDAPIVLSSPAAANQQVLVANSGRHNVLVSNQNGPIKVGDYISVSSLAGIGMKQDPTESQVVGQAAASFSGTANNLGSASVSSNNQKLNVAIGSIQVDLHLRQNPFYQKNPSVPHFLSSFAQLATTKQVSTGRIYLAAGILLVAAFITAILFYSSITGTMIAVGRNPLARLAIGRSLIRILITGLAILVGGAGLAYLMLRV